MSATTEGTTIDSLASTGRVHTHHSPGSSARARVGHFVRHFLEMCAAMCIGLGVSEPLYVWAAGQAGYTDPLLQFPELSAFVAAFGMTAPMVAWMRFRRMDWGSITEMSAAMVVEAILVIAAYWLGLLTNVPVGPTTSLWLWMHGLMMPAMLVPMLLRLDRYTSGHGAHAA